MAEGNPTIEIDDRQYDAETVSEAMLDAIIGRAPVAIMDDQSLRDGISSRIRWALGAVSLIAEHEYTDHSITDTAEAAALHLEQARDMFRALVVGDSLSSAGNRTAG